MERDLIKEAYSRENAWGISTAIDIFRCKYYRPEDVLTFGKDFFEAKDAKYNYLLRI